MIPPIYPLCYLLLLATTGTPWGWGRVDEARGEFAIYRASDARRMAWGPWDYFDEALRAFRLRAVRRPCALGG